MAGNLGTSLKRKRSRKDPMREYDKLPPELRAWVGTAQLPWQPGSVKRAFDKALRKTRSSASALDELNRLEARLLAKDAQRIWGPDYPVH